MNFQQLKYVRAAVQNNLNLTEVANVLFTSQSGVSKQIKELEAELGIEIFVRRGKRLIDANGRGFRWLQNGLHSFDFAFLRARPLWDLAVLPLLAMVTLVCGTGAWMGLRKLVRDLRRLPRRRRKIRARTNAIRHHVVEQAQPVTSADRGMA